MSLLACLFCNENNISHHYKMTPQSRRIATFLALLSLLLCVSSTHAVTKKLNTLMGDEDPMVSVSSSSPHCTDGTDLGELVYSQTERVVLIIWFVPCVLGVVLGEVVILYLGLCNGPLYILHHWLSHTIRDLRPFNCSNDHYEVDYASPCLSTMIVWHMTMFMFTFSMLRRVNANKSRKTPPQFRMSSMGYTLLGCSLFVTFSVVYTNNNTMGQSILGSLVGILYGMSAAVFLEYIWAPNIPSLIRIPPFSWREYTDNFYFHVTCKCKSETCSHRAGSLVMQYMSHVYSGAEKKYSTRGSSSGTSSNTSGSSSCYTEMDEHSSYYGYEECDEAPSVDYVGSRSTFPGVKRKSTPPPREHYNSSSRSTS